MRKNTDFNPNASTIYLGITGEAREVQDIQCKSLPSGVTVVTITAYPLKPGAPKVVKLYLNRTDRKKLNLEG